MRDFILWLGGLIILIMCFVPPHEVERFDAIRNRTTDEVVYRPVWSESSWTGTLSTYRDASVDVERLMLQVLVVLVGMGFLYFVSQDREKKKPEDPSVTPSAQ